MNKMNKKYLFINMAKSVMILSWLGMGMTYSMDGIGEDLGTKENFNLARLGYQQNILYRMNDFSSRISQIQEEDSSGFFEIRKEIREYIEHLRSVLERSSNSQLLSFDDFFDNTLNYNILKTVPISIQNDFPALSDAVDSLILDFDPFETNPNKKCNISLLSGTAAMISGLMSDRNLDSIVRPDRFHTELTESSIHELDFYSLEESSKNLLSEFSHLKFEDFLQGPTDAACFLYSLLWGTHENEVLKQKIFQNIKRDNEGNYYILNPNDNENVVVIPQELTSFTEGDVVMRSTLHPSKNNILRAIGMYVLKRMTSENEGDDPRAYQLYDDPNEGDFLFGHKVHVLSSNGLEGGDKFLVQDNGDVIIEYEKRREEPIANSEETKTVVDRIKSRITGDFVISVSGTKHAKVVYFNKSDGSWYYFDNEIDTTKTIDKALTLWKHCDDLLIRTFTFARIFGDFQEIPFEK